MSVLNRRHGSCHLVPAWGCPAGIRQTIRTLNRQAVTDSVCRSRSAMRPVWEIDRFDAVRSPSHPGLPLAEASITPTPERECRQGVQGERNSP